MKAALSKRLQVLEAHPPKVDPEHDRRYHAALKAMFDTLPHAGKWAPSKVAPFNCIEMPSDMEFLWDRHKAGTLTDADTDLMS